MPATTEHPTITYLRTLAEMYGAARQIDTGGGCTAILLEHPTLPLYVLVTDDNGAAPADPAECIVGIYDREECAYGGTAPVVQSAATLATVVDVIRELFAVHVPNRIAGRAVAEQVADAVEGAAAAEYESATRGWDLGHDESPAGGLLDLFAAAEWSTFRRYRCTGGLFALRDEPRTLRREWTLYLRTMDEMATVSFVEESRGDDTHAAAHVFYRGGYVHLTRFAAESWFHVADLHALESRAGEA